MKIVDFFKRILRRKDDEKILDAPKTQYQKLVESIDDLELCKMFVEKATRSVTPEIEKKIQKYGNKPYEYPLETRISKENTIELAQRFFESIDRGLYEKYNAIVNGSNPNIMLQMEEFNGKGASVNSPEKMPVTVYVPIRGDIRQLYELVHECTHTFDIDNGDTSTRKVLGEVAPQCMERLLDDFLLGMSDDDMRKYGFDKEILEKNVRERRISTFLSRFHNAQDLERRSGNRELDSRYMLAQIYSAHFNKFDKNEKKNKILSFIECVKNDEFENANSCFELSIEKNARLSGLHREAYVGDAISEVMDLVVSKDQDYSRNQQRELDGDDIVR